MNLEFPEKIPDILQPLVRSGAMPIVRQFCALNEEAVVYPEERRDPIGDRVWMRTPGLVHRYPDRALLHVTSACAVHCRFCFRRHVFTSEKGPLPDGDLERAIEYVRSKAEIREVILSGGDPLTLPRHRLERILACLAAIPHVETLRIHTRAPVVAPALLSQKLLAALTLVEKPIWMVLHVNSHLELTEPARTAIASLRRAGIPLLSQSVLLAGVNASLPDLLDLFRGLLREGVKPYYLHYPDLVENTHHFRIPLEDAIELVGQLRARLPGTAIPQFVVDIPGGYGKVPVPGPNVRQVQDSEWEFRSPLSGEWIRVKYPPCTSAGSSD